MTYAARTLAVIAGLAIIAVVTRLDFSGGQFVLWLACCAAGAALLIWGAKGLVGLYRSRRPDMPPAHDAD
ncbi:hypothetical protein AGMMS50218_15680 [Actinomycetota bacterium]|nr:hypothetical protein AGMMS50218_15680 [Actinomycetota bacterium]